MIVALDNSGRLGNRLVYFAYTCATALITGQRYVNVMAGPVMEFAELDSSVTRKYDVFCLANIPCLAFVLRLRAAWHERVRKLDVVKFLAENGRRVQLMRRNSFLPKVSCAWFYRDNDALVRMRSQICELLRPKSCFVLHPESFVKSLRSDGAALVGVHIRRKDYRTFENGRYFFTDAEYLRFMIDFENSAKTRTRFIIVSDETVDVKFFQSNGVDVAWFAGSDYREDLVALSFCDYVMGPVSTFSWWAAYYGGVRYCALRDRRQCIEVSSFAFIKGGEFELETDIDTKPISVAGHGAAMA